MIVLNKISKTYTSKKGVKTVALNGISLQLPNTGVVFLVGKSGAGKSTLLNVLGGLDYVDSGEIIVNGKSTKDFTKNEYDSYRNTYIGFVFQECYMLDNLTVGENIALAIKLQNRKPSDQEVAKILSDVGLEGYLTRRTNELSGGELQRVAIARALIKNPQIIIADEPTGALDSNTSTQIFETLKKLSTDHLILIVSHELEFAKNYADRIIEIKDGNIISDVTKTSYGKPKKVKKDKQTKQTQNANPNISFENGSISINPAHKLTADDVKLINDFINKQNKVEAPAPVVSEKQHFVPTTEVKEDDNKQINLIKSKLPLKDAIRMSLNALKHKKFKLVMCILLAVISFTTFGLSSLLTSFTNNNILSAKTFESSALNFARISKQLRDVDEETYDDGLMGEEDQNRFKKETGLNFTVLYSMNAGIENLPSTDIDPHYWQQFTNKAYLPKENFTDANISSIIYDEPVNLESGQVAITEYVAEMFQKYNYFDWESRATIEIKEPGDLIGKTLHMYDESAERQSVTFKIVDIYDTNFNRKDPYFQKFLNEKNRDNFYETEGYDQYRDYELAFANTLFMNKEDVTTKLIFSRQGEGVYSSLITGIPKNKTRELMAKIYSFADGAHDSTNKDKEEHPDLTVAKYRLVDSVSYNIRGAIESTMSFSTLFLLIGATFALFSGLLLANFIANSISHQRKEIGILRAIGARSRDVFKIYFAESAIIASVNFILSTLFTFLIFKTRLESELLQLTNQIPIYTFSYIQVFIILAVSFISVFLATFIPIRHIAKRKPIDTIRLK